MKTEREITFGETTLTVVGTLEKGQSETRESMPIADHFEGERFMWNELPALPDINITKPLCDIIDTINERYKINAWEMIDELLNQQ